MSLASAKEKKKKKKTSEEREKTGTRQLSHALDSIFLERDLRRKTTGNRKKYDSFWLVCLAKINREIKRLLYYFCHNVTRVSYETLAILSLLYKSLRYHNIMYITTCTFALYILLHFPVHCLFFFSVAALSVFLNAATLYWKLSFNFICIPEGIQIEFNVSYLL